jgi:formylglycine-generating enzyme required for sulfatase activity
MRGPLAAVALTLVVVACNALNGSGDLSVCSDCVEDAGTGDTSGGTSGGTSGTGGSSGTSGGSSGTSGTSGDAAPPTCNPGESIVNGVCTLFPSCRDANPMCGGASCCATGDVAGGTFNRKNSATIPATVSAFRLDLYEVTVARFRAYLAATPATIASPPAAGAGAHPKIANSGWNSAWDTYLFADATSLKASLATGANATFTPTPGANEQKPINWVRYLDAFAFCAWDGGRLPTLAELSFAQTGGGEQRIYPWSVPATSTTITSARAVYDCAFSAPAYSCAPDSCSDGSSSPCDTTTCISPNSCVAGACSGCSASDIAPVGSAAQGAGKFGQLDLGGSMNERVLDIAFVPPTTTVAPPMPCTDCAALPPAVLLVPRSSKNTTTDPVTTVILGGSWSDTSTSALRSASSSTIPVNTGADDVGFRCARD